MFGEETKLLSKPNKSSPNKTNNIGQRHYLYGSNSECRLDGKSYQNTTSCVSTSDSSGIPLSVVAANPLIEIRSRKGTYLSHRFANESSIHADNVHAAYSSCDSFATDDSIEVSPDENGINKNLPHLPVHYERVSKCFTRCSQVFSLARIGTRYHIVRRYILRLKFWAMGQYDRDDRTTMTYRGLSLTMLLAFVAIFLREHMVTPSYLKYGTVNKEIVEPVWASAVEKKVWNFVWGDKPEDRPPLSSQISSKNKGFDLEYPSFLRQSGKLHFSRKKSKSFVEAKLVIAGKLAVNEGVCNIAELGLDSGAWSLNERIQLSLYSSYSGGEVYYLLANHTFSSSSTTVSKRDERQLVSKSNPPGGDLIVVGAFDTTDRNSQVTYCSVGAWDGTDLSKVGEGLCNSALSKGMKITAAALAGPQDVYVGGAFQTRVWNGDRHAFVDIYNIAHYNAVDQVWLPLSIGQITCSWCTVTILSLAWDSTRRQLHVAGKFNAIDGHNIPSGLAIYHQDTGHLVAHPGGGLTMFNMTQNGVGTALQLDEQARVLYVMGSFDRLGTGEICVGLAAYEIEADRWTCLADPKHTVMPSGGGNMLLTPHGLMVAGRTTSATTWSDSSRPYTIALLKATLKKKSDEYNDYGMNSGPSTPQTAPAHVFEWSWLPGFDGHDQPLHSLANGFGDHQGTVFIAGDDLVAKWQPGAKVVGAQSQIVNGSGRSGSSVTATHIPDAVTVNLSKDHVRGSVMAIAQLSPETPNLDHTSYRLAVYLVSIGALMGMFLALLCNRSLNQTLVSWFFEDEENVKGISLDTLSYSVNMNDAYQKAMRNRCVQSTNGVQLIDPQSIILHRIIGEGTFGRVWSAKLNSSCVAVKEFVFAQAAVAGKSSQKDSIIEDIIGEAGMMSILRHPNVLQLFGCSLTAQAIWIVSELCSLGSLRQLLDDRNKEISLDVGIRIALQVAEGMMYLHNQSPPIIHRDLKSHNILIHETFAEASDVERIEGKSDLAGGYRVDQTEKLTVEQTIVAKIGDWGSAKATLSGSQTMTHGVGTSCWLAPEVIRNARSSKCSDVYSYGIILWEMATRAEVYANLESTQIIAQVANDNLRPPVPDNCPWASMMVRCWNEDPHARPTFREIVKWLNQIKDDLNGDEQSSITEWSHPSQASYQKQYINDL